MPAKNFSSLTIRRVFVDKFFAMCRWALTVKSPNLTLTWGSQACTSLSGWGGRIYIVTPFFQKPREKGIKREPFWDDFRGKREFLITRAFIVRVTIGDDQRHEVTQKM